MPVDLGNIPGSADRFEREYQRGVRQMQRTLDRAARDERRGHEYQNRTGQLEANTQASQVYSLGDADVVTLAADTEYASYVERRGLMQIEERAERAGEEIEYLMEGIAAAARVE